MLVLVPPLTLLFPPSLGAIAATARAELLAEWLSKRFDRRVIVEVAASYEELEARLLQRAVDLAWAPPVLCARIVDSVPAVFTAVRRGSASFRSGLVARRRDVSQLEDLRGKVAGWVDPRSSGGYLLPIRYLRAQGHEPDRFFAEQRFLGSYGDALRALVNRAVHVAPVFVHGADDEQVHATLVELVGVRAATTLGMVAITDPCPGDGLVVVRGLEDGGIDVAAVEAIVEGPQTSLLFSILEAEGLQRAIPSDYASLWS